MDGVDFPVSDFEADVSFGLDELGVGSLPSSANAFLAFSCPCAAARLYQYRAWASLRRLRRARHSGGAKRLPHVHHRQANAPRLFLAQPVVELHHAQIEFLGNVLDGGLPT